jgi:hypothetical protein
MKWRCASSAAILPVGRSGTAAPPGATGLWPPGCPAGTASSPPRLPYDSGGPLPRLAGRVAAAVLGFVAALFVFLGTLAVSLAVALLLFATPYYAYAHMVPNALRIEHNDPDLLFGIVGFAAWLFCQGYALTGALYVVGFGALFSLGLGSAVLFRKSADDSSRVS